MKKENVVYLFIGQRGAGKSHYAQRLMERQPELILISRDEILAELYGSINLDPYTGAHRHAQGIVYEKLDEILKGEGVKVLLDHWTGCSDDRWRLVRRLQSRGADRVVALYFTTLLEVAEQWFWQKPGIAKMSEIRQRKGEKLSFYDDSAVSHDYALFHKLAENIDSDGFNEVVRINPQDELIGLL